MGLEGIGRFRGSHTCRRQDFTSDDAEMGWACLLPDGSGLSCCALDLLDRGLATRHGAFVAVACIRSANRHYHLIHPEQHLEASTSVLVVWTTLVAGVTGA